MTNQSQQGDVEEPPSASSTELIVDVQFALDDANKKELPTAKQLILWAQLAYQSVAKRTSEITIRLVDDAEMLELNAEYRQKEGLTNVLSFPVDTDFPQDSELDVHLLGDIVICHSVVLDEAKKNNISSSAHYAHMVTHGVLHLCGYQHESNADAEQMESLEVAILAQSGIGNPYHHAV